MRLRGKIEIVSQTDVGQLRDHNEDFVAADDKLGLMVLADGMGGLNAGEVASSMAVHLLTENLSAYLAVPREETGSASAAKKLKSAIEETNSAVFHVSQTQIQCKGMGTTLVAAMIAGDRLVIGHIGDSRAYRFRDGELQQLTRDHSYVQELMDKGLYTAEEARASNQKNVVTRALGIAPTVKAEVHEHDIEIDDIYLLCSDGLSDLVIDGNIATSIRELGGDLRETANHLVNLANASGGKDNISVILLKINRNLSDPDKLFRRILNWFE